MFAVSTWGFSFLKWGCPQIIHFNGIFHYKPSILGYPHFRKSLLVSTTNGFGSWKKCPYKAKVMTFHDWDFFGREIGFDQTWE
jgi:hypothetical protein